jgi:hypothetical protein
MAFCDTYLIKLKICVIKDPLQLINLQIRVQISWQFSFWMIKNILAGSVIMLSLYLHKHNNP